MSITADSLRAKGFIEQPDGSFARVQLDEYRNFAGIERVSISREVPLHEEIMAWADAQYPRVKFIHARTDQKSSIQIGAQDFTIFLPQGRVLCVEVKTKDGKLSLAQAGWAKEMEMLGHTVHIVRSMAQFLELVKSKG